ncbi:Glycosyl transferases group 1 [Roseivivax sp. THAF40]|uniref:glycosyltransferase n=1 Tax=unclassified Roseivivax TaxID=2639302 RepID=UPI0012689DAC|nr:MULTISPECIES: glycosyltransferase [unclassified Roseivivax]QFS83731.1 Glycosyl transferases group 1 [Roseivivax sp. THAF197b]QFT47533.1 Glycosyl transferases group 1 [Roseivivax sp. THAF40]
MIHSRKIALVSAFPPGKGSLNEYGLHLARGFAERPDVAEVVVLADRLDAPMAELDLGPKIRVRRVWRFNALGTPVDLLRALRSERPDGIVYNLQMASFGDRELPAALGLCTPLATRLAGLPSGIIAHNLVTGVDLEQTLLKGQPVRQAVVRAGASLITRAMTGANYMTVTLRSYAETMQARYPGADISLVPHGTFDTEQRPWHPLSTRPLKIVTMGKFGTYKRLETLLEAFDRVRKTPGFEGLTLEIGGSDHPNTPGYMAGLAAARAEDPGVCFRGYLAEEEIPDFFETARISVFDYETTTGSSGVLHQTASYGALPVFPRIGDFVDLCEDEGLTGLHYEPGDVDGMAAAILRGLRETDASEALARANAEAARGMPFAEVIAVHMDKLQAA